MHFTKHASLVRPTAQERKKIIATNASSDDVFDINPLRAKLFRGSINIYLHFVSFLHIDTTQVVEILPQVRQEPTYST